MLGSEVLRSGGAVVLELDKCVRYAVLGTVRGTIGCEILPTRVARERKNTSDRTEYIDYYKRTRRSIMIVIIIIIIIVLGCFAIRKDIPQNI